MSALNEVGVGKYVQRPLRVTALRWTGVNVEEMTEFLGSSRLLDTATYTSEAKHAFVMIRGNWVPVMIDDYVIRHGDGRLEVSTGPQLVQRYRRVREAGT